MPWACIQRMKLSWKTALNDMPGDHYKIESNDKIPDCKYWAAWIQAVQNQKQTNAGVLEKFTKFKIGRKVLYVNSK